MDCFLCFVSCLSGRPKWFHDLSFHSTFSRKIAQRRTGGVQKGTIKDSTKLRDTRHTLPNCCYLCLVFFRVDLWPPRLLSLFAYLLLPSLAQLALLVVLTLLALTAKVLISWVASGMVKDRRRGGGGGIEINRGWNE